MISVGKFGIFVEWRCTKIWVILTKCKIHIAYFIKNEFIMCIMYGWKMFKLSFISTFYWTNNGHKIHSLFLIVKFSDINLIIRTYICHINLRNLISLAINSLELQIVLVVFVCYELAFSCEILVRLCDYDEVHACEDWFSLGNRIIPVARENYPAAS